MTIFNCRVYQRTRGGTFETCRHNGRGPSRFGAAILAAAMVVLGTDSLRAARAAESARSNWKEFVDKKLGYRATFPGTPKVKMSNMRDEKGNAHEVYNCGVEFNEGRTKYAVQCELQVAEVKIEDMKEMAKNSVAKWSKLKYVKSAKEVQAGDYAGFETLESSRFKGTPCLSRTRYYWIGKVTYHVYVRAPEGELDEKAASRFLDSFAVLSAAERKRDASDKILVRDSFSGPKGMFLVKHFMDVGTGWREYGGGAWRILNKRATITVQSSQDVIATDAGEANATLTCDLITPAKEGMDVGLVVRMVDNDNYWMLAIRDNRVEAYKKSAGNYVSLGVPPFAFRPSTTYRLKVTVKDNTMTAFVDGKQVIGVLMDAFQTATKFGLRDNSAPKSQPSWQNFEVTRP